MNRSAGILLSVTSLPSGYGIGCFDRSAYRFIDWLAQAGQTYWQILPLGPTSYGASADSPYQSYSAFAGNPYFISLDGLIKDGVLARGECDSVDFGASADRVDYEKLHLGRYPLLRKAFARSDLSRDGQYQTFCRENRWWLDDYALFMALKAYFEDAPWPQWPEELRLRLPDALEKWRQKLWEDVNFQKYLQYQFDRQWQAVKTYANKKGIQIVGDIPIYVSYDSADVWAHPELFQLDGERRPVAVAGCPPDYFSETGQLWGNPLYRWEYHQNTGFAWWTARMRQSFRLYDMVRIDHFRGFDEYYSIPYGSENAINGHWEKGPGMTLFRQLEQHLGSLPVIAEDLGLMTDTVRQLVRKSGFPNMKVLEFAFDPEDVRGANDHLPHNYPENCVVYTGTHDNDTLAGWLSGLDEPTLRMAQDYLGSHSDDVSELRRAMIRLCMCSSAKICIIPMQDHLELGSDCRMNTPSTVEGNWAWRLKGGEWTPELQKELRRMTMLYGRAAEEKE